MTPKTTFYRSVKPEGAPLAEGLLNRMPRAVELDNGITFVGTAAGGEEPVTVSWGRLYQDARAVAASLQQRGISPGDHIHLLGTTTRQLVTAIQGVWLAGGCVTILHIPMRFHSLEQFMSQTRSLLHHGDASMLLIDPDLAAYYQPEPQDPPVVTLDQVQPGPGNPGADDYREVPEDPQRLAILQFTSGSTAEPKGVKVLHHQAGANIDGMEEAAQVSTDDIFVSWLPLYHDMGLIGFLTLPMTMGCSLVLASPQDFLSRPADWMRWMSEYRGTVTAGPNFSYVLATRALRRAKGEGEQLDLSPVRIALNGSEPIDPEAVDRFVEVAEPFGFNPGAVFCAYGIAEVTLGGSFSPLMRGMACDIVNRSALESEGVARPVEPSENDTRRLPLLGPPVPGLEMRICDSQTGEVKSLREVGELEIRGEAVTPGYYRRPELDESLFRDGWLRTGDLAYFVEPPEGGTPELVICGRIKDVIIVSGRNIFPEDIERAVSSIEGVRAGNVIAFGLGGGRGKETLGVVAECKQEASPDLQKKIKNTVVEVCGVPPRDIALLPPGTVPKTSSGKLQRGLCRNRYLNGELPSLDVNADTGL